MVPPWEYRKYSTYLLVMGSEGCLGSDKSEISDMESKKGLIYNCCMNSSLTLGKYKNYP